MAITKKSISIATEKNTVAALIRNQRLNILAATRKVPLSVLAGDATRAARWRDAAERAHGIFSDGGDVISVDSNTLFGLQNRLATERQILEVLTGDQSFALEPCNG